MKAYIYHGKEIKLDNLDVIHINHDIPMSVSEIKEDVYKPYVVYEQLTNHTRNHGIMAASKFEAMEAITDYLLGTEDWEDSGIFSLFADELTF